MAYEGPGAIGDAIASSGRPCTVVRTDRGDPIPSPDEVGDLAGLFVMGGPMSVHDDLDWLSAERLLLRAAVAASLPVLGVCLGAQQLALALGAEVSEGAAPEIGVGEVHLTPESSRDALFGSAPTPLPCIHWHGDTFTLPVDAVLLASSEAYPNQAFRVGPSAYGLQFHVEVTAALVGHWTPHLPSGIFVRMADVAHIARHGAAIISRFVALAAD
jgi:GMP synthase-like glutamine amidotransferase